MTQLSIVAKSAALLSVSSISGGLLCTPSIMKRAASASALAASLPASSFNLSFIRSFLCCDWLYSASSTASICTIASIAAFSCSSLSACMRNLTISTADTTSTTAAVPAETEIQSRFFFFSSCFFSSGFSSMVRVSSTLIVRSTAPSSLTRTDSSTLISSSKTLPFLASSFIFAFCSFICFFNSALFSLSRRFLALIFCLFSLTLSLSIVFFRRFFF